MTRVLIVSVGGSSVPIVNAIGSVQPDFVYFLCSTGKAGSDATVEQTIVPSAKLAAGSYSIARVQSPNDLQDVLAGCAKIEADLEARVAGADLDVVTNYTGGTRTMSAGLVTLAQRRGWDAELTARPTQKWSGRISKASLEAVTVFSSIELFCSAGINVIIGENSTGKTHLLKSMYALLRAAEESDTKPSLGDRGDKLERVLGGQVRSFLALEGEPSRVSLDCEEALFERTEEGGNPASWSLPSSVRVRTLFLPSREVLAMYRGFVRAYEERELAFDETYYDLCRELAQEQLGEIPPAFSAVLEELEGVLGGPVRLEMNSFAVHTKNGPVPALMVAEGHRKLAALAYLIKCGALKDESVLFWDEPEANLNPKLVRSVARVIRALAKAGIQIFVATHDYLLARELSMEAEYNPEDVDTRYFALYRPSVDGPVEVEDGAYWGDLQHNSILDEYTAHYEREQELFAGETDKELQS